MTHEEQAELESLKIIVQALLMHAVDPDGNQSADDARRTLSNVQNRSQSILDGLSIDVTNSTLAAAKPFHETIGSKLEEFFNSIHVED